MSAMRSLYAVIGRSGPFDVLVCYGDDITVIQQAAVQVHHALVTGATIGLPALDRAVLNLRAAARRQEFDMLPLAIRVLNANEVRLAQAPSGLMN